MDKKSQKFLNYTKDEELKQFCSVSYSKNQKGKEIKVITYPKLEDYKMSEEQIECFAKFFYDNRMDIKKYINEHQEEYEKFLRKEKLKTKD